MTTDVERVRRVRVQRAHARVFDAFARDVRVALGNALDVESQAAESRARANARRRALDVKQSVRTWREMRDVERARLEMRMKREFASRAKEERSNARARASEARARMDESRARAETTRRESAFDEPNARRALNRDVDARERLKAFQVRHFVRRVKRPSPLGE